MAFIISLECIGCNHRPDIAYAIDLKRHTMKAARRELVGDVERLGWEVIFSPDHPEGEHYCPTCRRAREPEELVASKEGAS